MGGAGRVLQRVLRVGKGERAAEVAVPLEWPPGGRQEWTVPAQMALAGAGPAALVAGADEGAQGFDPLFVG
jgi:hypothetical protein